jgi:hypothetical protein
VNNFFFFSSGEDKRVCDTVANAIDSLKQIIANKPTLNPETVNILEINTAKEKWEIKSVPWSKIAVELLKHK